MARSERDEAVSDSLSAVLLMEPVTDVAEFEEDLDLDFPALSFTHLSF